MQSGENATLNLQQQIQTLEQVRQHILVGASLLKKQAADVAAVRRWKNIEIAFVVGLIFSLLMLVLQKVISIFTRYKALINGIDKDKPPLWPTSGFWTAVAVDVPALSSVVGFPNNAIPVAAYLCYYSAQFTTAFPKNPTLYLQRMWLVGIEGSHSREGPTAYNALTIVCLAWANAQGIQECQVACPVVSAPQWYDYLSSGLSSGMGAGFAAQSISRVAVTAGSASVAAGPIAMVIGSGIGVLAQYLTYKQKQKAVDGQAVNGELCVPS